MGDLISRQWMIDHCFFETDKELARNAPDVDANEVEIRKCRDCKYCYMDYYRGNDVPACAIIGCYLYMFDINKHFCSLWKKNDGGNE